MGEETDLKILETLADIENDIRNGNYNDTHKSLYGGFLRPEIIVALILPAVGMIGLYNENAIRLVQLENNSQVCKSMRLEDKKYDNMLEGRIGELDSEIHTCERNIDDLVREHAQSTMDMTRRIRILEKAK